MERAFIMVKIDTGHAEEVRRSIAAFSGASEAHVIAGEYDVIVEAASEQVYDLMHTVATDIRGLSAVVDTKTYICLE